MAKGNSKGIPVLMYHALEDAAHPAGAKDQGEQLYVLPVSQFREQMEYLHKEGYTAFLLNDLQQMEEWPEKAVVLTFDDGHESNYTLALPILQEFGYKAHFFITTGWIGTPHFMTEQQIQGLHHAGMGIGSHGVTHRFLSDLSEDDIKTEMVDSKMALETCTGTTVSSLSYPGGRMNQLTQCVAQTSGYEHVCTSVPQVNQKIINKSNIYRLVVNADMTLDSFAALVQGRGLGMVRFRHALLATTKVILGNDLYTRFRSVIIK